MSAKRRIVPHAIVTIALGCSTTLSVPAAGNDVLTLTEGTNMAVTASPVSGDVVMDLQGRLWRLDGESSVAEPLTGPLDDARRPAWSPDGRHIAYQSHTTDYWQIHLLDVETGESRVLTSGPFDHREPAWHPSGEQLLMSSDRGGDYGIWQLDLATGALEQLTLAAGNESEPAASPDGDWVVYRSTDGDGDRLEMKLRERSPVTVYRSDNRLAAPSWRPDGSIVTFVETTRFESTLKMLILSDPLVVKPLSRHQDVFPFPVSWRDRLNYVYTADGLIMRQAFGDRAPGVVPFAAEWKISRPDWQRRGYAFDDLTRPARGVAGLDVRPDGSVVVASLGDLWLVSEGSSARPLMFDDFVDAHPSVSPDGGSVAFVSDRSGTMQIWRLDFETGRLSAITRDAVVPFYPVFSPDGARIAFLSGGLFNVWGRASLVVVDVKTRESTIVADSLNGPGMPMWSADGRSISLAVPEPASTRYREGKHRFATFAADGSGALAPMLSNVTPASRSMDGPDLSPDGRRIAMTVDGRVAIAPAQGQGLSFLLTDEPGAMPRWDADGESIVYLASGSLKRIPAGGGKPSDHGSMPVFRQTASGDRYVIRAGRLFDGVLPEYRYGVDIVVDGNRIERIDTAPPGEADFDASRLTALPGLVDMHVHQSVVTGERLGRIWLAHGVTAVRETGADPYDALERKESWASGRRLGPRQFHAGRLFDGARVYYAQATHVPDSGRIRTEIEQARLLDYDMIKTYVRLPDRRQAEIIEAAHAAGLPVSSHEILPAAVMGADGIEHLGATSRHGYSTKLSALGRSYQDVVSTIAETGITITPTIALMGDMALAALRDDPLFEARQYESLFTAAERAEFGQFLRQLYGTSDVALEARLQPMRQTIGRIVAAGGRVAAGTDAPFIPYGLSLHAELAALVAAGLQPFQALRSASWEPAHWLGIEKDLGTLEAGKLADFVLVDGDPLSDIADALNVRAVVSNGRLFRVEDLLSVE